MATASLLLTLLPMLATTRGTVRSDAEVNNLDNNFNIAGKTFKRWTTRQTVLAMRLQPTPTWLFLQVPILMICTRRLGGAAPYRVLLGKW